MSSLLSNVSKQRKRRNRHPNVQLNFRRILSHATMVLKSVVQTLLFSCTLP